ncbi:dTDP-4-dehydrorhamnose reductase family protein [Shewanella waksmanii]|uniref:dTDP-4-dehydrorhamnose reductase family protein n=1 Tax=Shewanella waksmanii TaxID=213783 RepID=UPI00373557C3
MSKVLVTGASGLLGRAVYAELSQQPQFEVVGSAYRRTRPPLQSIDLTSAEAIDEAFSTIAPDIIVHCAAERRPDVSEQDPQAALALNVEATRALALAAKRHNTWLIYISTDYVFDGTASNYTELDKPNPVNFYGESKWRGEQVVQAVSDDFVILRLPILYGQVERIDESAVLVLLQHLNAEQTQSIDNWAVRSPTSTADIAQTLVKLIQRKKVTGDVHGIYHFSASERMSKYDMLLKLAKLVGKSAEHLEAADLPTDTAKRPQDCSLLCQRLDELGIKSELSFLEGAYQALADSPQALNLVGMQLHQQEK